jgi:twitching motility protein PilI
MNQYEVRQVSGESAEASDWMLPGAALAQFEPPEGAHMVVSSEAQKEKFARYGFRVGELGLLINPNTGSEVLAMPQIATLPGAPPGFVGLINLRGNLVPLYELRVLLGIAPRATGVATRVQVFGQDAQAVGIIIDDYPVVLADLSPLPNFPPLPDALEKHVPAAYVQDDNIWLEFDHGTFFEEICNSTSLQYPDNTTLNN